MIAAFLEANEVGIGGSGAILVSMVTNDMNAKSEAIDIGHIDFDDVTRPTRFG